MIRWEENDGSIEHCVLIGNGPRFDAWYVYDLASKWWGENAHLFLDDLRPDAKRYEVEFPDGSRKRYVDLTDAKRAIERSAS